MGITYAEIELVRVADQILAHEGYLPEEAIRRLKVLALVDSGASMLAVPRATARALDLRKTGEVETELANGSIMRADVVGPVEIRFRNRSTTVNAVVIEADTDVLLGAIPMQGMDVLIDPRQEQLILNPQSPDTARMFLKRSQNFLKT